MVLEIIAFNFNDVMFSSLFNVIIWSTQYFLRDRIFCQMFLFSMYLLMHVYTSRSNTALINLCGVLRSDFTSKFRSPQIVKNPVYERFLIIEKIIYLIFLKIANKIRADLKWCQS